MQGSTRGFTCRRALIDDVRDGTIFLLHEQTDFTCRQAYIF